MSRPSLYSFQSCSLLRNHDLCGLQQKALLPMGTGKREEGGGKDDLLSLLAGARLLSPASTSCPDPRPSPLQRTLHKSDSLQGVWVGAFPPSLPQNSPDRQRIKGRFVSGGRQAAWRGAHVGRSGSASHCPLQPLCLLSFILLSSLALSLIPSRFFCLLFLSPSVSAGHTWCQLGLTRPEREQGGRWWWQR